MILLRLTHIFWSPPKPMPAFHVFLCSEINYEISDEEFHRIATLTLQEAWYSGRHNRVQDYRCSYEDDDKAKAVVTLELPTRMMGKHYLNMTTHGYPEPSIVILIRTVFFTRNMFAVHTTTSNGWWINAQHQHFLASRLSVCAYVKSHGGAKKNPKPLTTNRMNQLHKPRKSLFSVQIINLRETNNHLGINKGWEQQEKLHMPEMLQN